MASVQLEESLVVWSSTYLVLTLTEDTGHFISKGILLISAILTGNGGPLILKGSYFIIYPKGCLLWHFCLQYGL